MLGLPLFIISFAILMEKNTIIFSVSKRSALSNPHPRFQSMTPLVFLFAFIPIVTGLLAITYIFYVNLKKV